MTVDEGFPIALGVLFDHPRPTFDRAVTEQNAKLSEGKKPDLQALLNRGQTWVVE
jgi:2-oxoglutarate ferredoxin oxidoreductase subunit beta